MTHDVAGSLEEVDGLYIDFFQLSLVFFRDVWGLSCTSSVSLTDT